MKTLPTKQVAAIGMTVAALCAAVLCDPAAARETLERPERRSLIEATATAIRERYVDAAKGARIAAALDRDATTDSINDADPQTFAKSLTHRLRDLSSDGHFAVDYSEVPVPARQAAMSDYDRAQIEKHLGADMNYGVNEVRRLDGNIGYLDLRVFAPPSLGAEIVAGAMTVLAGSDALIIDLRHNTGGDAAMTAFLAAYLLDQPIQLSTLYDRPSDMTQVAVTPDWVPGRRFGGTKPVYVLVSHDTFSAAEAFTYDLQAAGRIIVVGATTGGGAHPFANRRIAEHFVLRLPEERVTNPKTGTDWEDVGVKPDIAVPADQAFDTAFRLLRARTDKASAQPAK